MFSGTLEILQATRIGKRRIVIHAAGNWRKREAGKWSMFPFRFSPFFPEWRSRKKRAMKRFSAYSEILALIFPHPAG